MRALTALLLIVLSLAGTSVHALGLGNMLTRSAMNESLDADIELLSVNGAELNAVKVGLANAADFQLAGVALVPVLDHLKFQVMNNRLGKPVIRITSDLPVNEPFLNFLIQVDWPGGRLLREYTALLDPPVTTGFQSPKIAAPDGKIALTPTPSAVAIAELIGAASRTDEYGPVKAKETLWSIAGQVRPDGVTMQQMMVALQRANPQAFIGGNMNRLRQGQILRVPDLNEILDITPMQAAAIFRQQVDTWLGRVSPTASVQGERDSPTIAPESDDQSPSQASSDTNRKTVPKPDVLNAPQQPRDRLQIATARPEGEGDAGASEGRGEIRDHEGLAEHLMQVRENAETARQEASILRSEIDDLQTRLNDMQRLLALKDEQLAQLQDRIQQRPEQTMAASALPDMERVLSGQAAKPEGEGHSLANSPVAPLPDQDPMRLDHSNEPLAPEMDGRPDGEKIASSWWQNLLSQPVYVALGAILLLLLVFLLVRRKRSEVVAEEIAGQDPFDAGYVASPPSFIKENEGDECIRQADADIARGDFAQAEERLQQAQHEFPQHLEIPHKLLQIYFATENTQAFIELAQQLFDQHQPSSNPEAWAEIVAMGEELAPDNALFRGAGEMNFALEDDFSATEKTDAANRQEPPPFSSVPLDQPLDIERAFQHVVGEDNLTVESSDSTDPDHQDRQNKLDLARVYIDMGDADGARGILQEVQATGSPLQQQQAAELLAKI